MIDQIITFLAHNITLLIEKTGYYGVFLLMTAESALIPIPSEITMPFAGYLSSTGKMNLYLLAAVGALANLVGSLLAYWLGFWAEGKVLRKWIRKYGMYLLITMDDYDRAERWLKKYGESISFFSRILPVVRTFISLPIGVAKMNLFRFSCFTFLGSLIWSFFLAYIGFIMGRNWDSIEVYYRRFEDVIILALAGLIIYYVVHKIQKFRSSGENKKTG